MDTGGECCVSMHEPAAPEAVEGRGFASAPAICVPEKGFAVITTMMDTQLRTIMYRPHFGNYWDLLG